MHDEAALLQAMQANPDDAALRLVFADWLEERGDSRGELLRLLHTLTQSVEVPDRSKLEDRLRSLVESGVQPVGAFVTNAIGMKFVWIPAGTFLMGSPENEEDRSDQDTQHTVTLTKGFYLAIYPVTQSCWQEIIGKNPSYHQGDDFPVEQVSWHDSQRFLRKLSEQEGHAYRLPTEAELEYACRAGTTTPFFFGDTIATDQANYDGDYLYGKGKKGLRRGQTTPSGIFPPNAWGLHDMHGNVSDWCADWYGGDYLPDAVTDPQGPKRGKYSMLRGGSFATQASGVRSASRLWYLPTTRSPLNGFRPVRTLAP
jgi:uncharacterized protein (TIGR02996 family)